MQDEDEEELSELEAYQKHRDKQRLESLGLLKRAPRRQPPAVSDSSGSPTLSDQKLLLFQTDPKRFMEILMIDEPDKRAEALRKNPDDVVLCEIIRYGCFNDSTMIRPLAELYRNVVLRQYPEERCWKLYRHIADLLLNVDFVSVNALRPFIAEETSTRIVSSAIIDYVSLGPLTKNDEMSRPRDIIGMIETGAVKNSGAAFGGLLHLGDRRVCKLLWPIRELLEKDEIEVLQIAR